MRRSRDRKLHELGRSTFQVFKDNAEDFIFIVALAEFYYEFSSISLDGRPSNAVRAYRFDAGWLRKCAGRTFVDIRGARPRDMFFCKTALVLALGADSMMLSLDIGQEKEI